MFLTNIIIIIQLITTLYYNYTYIIAYGDLGHNIMFMFSLLYGYI